MFNTYKGRTLVQMKIHANQQNAEIERLRAALRDLCRAYVGLLESGRDRITSLGGDCDSVEKMETGDPALIAAKAALNPQK